MTDPGTYEVGTPRAVGSSSGRHAIVEFSRTEPRGGDGSTVFTLGQAGVVELVNVSEGAIAGSLRVEFLDGIVSGQFNAERCAAWRAESDP